MLQQPASAAVHGRRRIPGPRGVELWKFLAHLRDRPHERLLDLALKYGDIVMLDFTAERVVLLAKPEYIEHVLHHRHQNYDKQTFRWQSVRQVWGNGLLTADGDQWRRQRQRMQPAFHQEAMKEFADIVVDEARRIADAWASSATRGEPRDVYQDMLACAMRAITRAAFGSDIEGKTDVVIKALADVNHYINPMSLPNLLRVPITAQRLLNPAYGSFRRAYSTIDDILSDIVTSRLSARIERRDLLGTIMSARDEETGQTMTPAQLHDEMMGILMAGHETTGVSMASCWYWLSQSPDVERQLHSELDTVLAGRVPTQDDISHLPYSRLVMQEVLRIAPPTWGLDRRARENDEIDGYVIPRGAKVAFSAFVMHHHPRYWTDPETFSPLRFTQEQAADRPAYAYFPFGGGPRRCVGMRFAMLEAQLILSVLAQSFTARVKPGFVVELEPRVNLAPKHGVQMQLERQSIGARSATH